jgi:hypothetical protein
VAEVLGGAYAYKMVPIPPDFEAGREAPGGQDVAACLERVVNEYARQGWEFYRVDAVRVRARPGCLGSLLGFPERTVAYSVITFRRLV